MDDVILNYSIIAMFNIQAILIKISHACDKNSDKNGKFKKPKISVVFLVNHTHLYMYIPSCSDAQVSNCLLATDNVHKMSC